MAAPPWVQWLQQRAPDAERWLAAAVGGTRLLQGGAADYAVVFAVACAFPVMRLIMDRAVYRVSFSRSGQPHGMLQLPLRPLPFPPQLQASA